MIAAREANFLRVRVAAFVVRDGHLLVVEHEKDQRRYVLLPGGGIEPGETLQMALVRELSEEIGVKAQVGPLIGISLSSAPSGDRNIVQPIFRTRIEGEPASTGRDRRVVDAHWLSAEQLATATLRPDTRSWLTRWLAREGPDGDIECFHVLWSE